MKNIYVKNYYKAFKDLLIGPNWNNSYGPSNVKSLDIFSKTRYCYIIKNIIKFIVTLEINSALENHFFEAIFYYVHKSQAYF